MATVIVGAGIIGTSTAYYLSNSSANPQKIHLVEACPELFASASGYAAGFLARDWFSPQLAKLGELSFDLHKQLAEENDGYERWGYTRSTGTSLAEAAAGGENWLIAGVSRSAAAEESSSGVGDVEDGRPRWLQGTGDISVISGGGTTAQVDPPHLCHFLLDSCLARGVQLHKSACPISVSRAENGDLSSVTIEDTSNQETKTIPCSHLVIAGGAWTPKIFSTLFPKSKTKIPITSLAGHSLVLRSPHFPPRAVPRNDIPRETNAVFTTEAEGGYSPELFSRMPDGDIYLAGLNSLTYPLPKVANERIIDAKSIAVLKRTAERLLGNDVETIRESVCWRPVGRNGPIICDMSEKDEKGVIVNAGHGP
ncbi:hypothetical protein MMC28_010544 [Mycoblastus sanguinarius]|nr:hypothetical protein [Mycoblastus sanguinarius]